MTGILSRLDSWLRPKKVLWPRLDIPAYLNRHYGRTALILGAGPSLRTHEADIRTFIQKRNPVMLAANRAFIPGIAADYTGFTNRRRFCTYAPLATGTILVGPHIRETTTRAILPSERQRERLPFVNQDGPFAVQDGIIQCSCIECGILLFAVAFVMGAVEVWGVGFDGYVRGAVNHADPAGDADFKIERSLERQERIGPLLVEMQAYFLGHKVGGPWIMGKTVYAEVARSPE